MIDAPTLVHRLLELADTAGGRTAMIVLPNGEQEAGRITYGELDAAARTLAARLQAVTRPGDRALIVAPSGPEFAVSFLGCLYAGVLAVPTVTPRTSRHLQAVHAVAGDARPSVVLTITALYEKWGAAASDRSLASVPWMTVDARETAEAAAWRPPALAAGALAFVQYTSGSTATPKGVMVTHGNLMANHRHLAACLDQSEDTTIVGWLPLFHDMGLIGHFLQAIFLGSTSVLMPPEAFLVKPVRWLRAIARYQGRQNAAPTFALRLCADRVTDAERSDLDLSSWERVCVGAEPIRADTLARFVERFAPCGLRRDAIYPCYGLAEATLFVAGGSSDDGFTTGTFDTAALEAGRAVPAADGPSRTIVAAGREWPEQRVVIVNPETGRRCEPDDVGEIWVSGPNVAHGYWERPDESMATFDARLPDMSDVTWLRTGDLGFLHQEALYIAGRLKDLVIIAGRNHHPADVEITVESAHAAIRAGGAAAFAIETSGTEALVVVAEIERTSRRADVDEVSRAIARAVAERHDLVPQAVAVVRPASLPRTSSGKIQRHLCRANYLSGMLALWDDR